MARRWQRWAVVILALIVVLVVIAWLAIPSVLVAVARRYLPAQVNRSLVVTQAATALSGLTTMGMTRVLVAVNPGRIQALAAENGTWVPKLVLRDGLCALATWHDVKNAPELPVNVSVVVRQDADPIQVLAAIPAEPLAELIARTAEPVVFAGLTLRWRYRLNPGSVVANDGPPVTTATGVRRRFRVEASGSVTAMLDDAVCEIAVTRLVGHVDLELDRRADGWHMHGTAEVETITSQVERCTSPLLQAMSGNLKNILEILVNSNVLSEHARRKDILPMSFPVDCGLQAVVTRVPEDCSAAVDAMLPLR
jgi:hypothetical protein